MNKYECNILYVQLVQNNINHNLFYHDSKRARNHINLFMSSKEECE